MADWTSGFDALRTALQFRAQQDAQKKQDQALADYRNQTLELERSRQEQLRKSNEAQDRYRQGMLDAQEDQLGLQRDRYNLDLDAQLFDQSLKAPSVRPGTTYMPPNSFPSILPGMPGAPQQSGMSMGGQNNPFGPSMVLTGYTVDDEGKVRSTYGRQYASTKPEFIDLKTSSGAIVTYEVTTNPTTGKKEYRRVPRSETEETKDEATTVANMVMAQKSLDNLDEAVRQYGGFESANPAFAPFNAYSSSTLPGRIEDYEQKLKAGTLTEEERLAGRPMHRAEAAARLKADPYELALAIAKVVDPGSVAREGEVAAAQRFMIPMGFWTSNDVTKAAIARAKKQLQDRIDALGLRDKVQNYEFARNKDLEPPAPQKFDTMDDFARSGLPFGYVLNPATGRYEPAGEIR